MNRTDPLVELIFNRLADDQVPDDTAELVLAALSSEADLAAALNGDTTDLNRSTPAPAEPPAQIWLSSITVAGFRGVGQERTLPIGPGPGITLVVGRNGSGKSSFAEAVELALTGDSARWADRNSVWRTGWRNLHSPDPCSIEVQLRVDGVAKPVTVSRSWHLDAGLTDAEVTVASEQGRQPDLTELGLARPLTLYRPFLTAAELGRLTAGTQSQLFDAISAILGLEAITDADQRLMAATRPVDTTIKQVRAQRAALAARLAEVDDDRARRAAILLKGRSAVDLDTLAAILDEPDEATAYAPLRLCRAVVDMPLPAPESVPSLATQLVNAATEARRYDGGRSRAALRSAELLRLAIEHHDDTGDGPCPVCSVGTLDRDWRTAAAASLTQLRDRSVAAQTANARLDALLKQTRYLIDDVMVPDGDVAEVPLDTLRQAVADLQRAPGEPTKLAAHLTDQYPKVVEAARRARTQAEEVLRQRDTGWRQAAADLRAWMDTAARLPQQETTLARVKAARSWLKTTGAQLRNERLAPFAEHSQRIWAQLRQESNVELGAMTLEGSNTR
ncbi:ATP-binding protein, partial [Micromonospora musae]|uniref:AAA family ATPase n=1 Tax=Micromonospora musae TaxID=1894970 RepID=UPI0033C2E63C